MDLKTALAEIEKLKTENKNLREQLIELLADKMKMEENWEDESSVLTKIAHENKFLKNRVIDLEQSYNTINEELKRIKQKYETNDLDSFMELYGSVADRCDIKVIQNKYFEKTGIKYSVQQIKRELEGIGYCVKRNEKSGRNYYASKNVGGYLYIVQLLKHKDTNIFKAGRTFNMKNRLRTYKQHDGGATEIVCKPVNNQFKAESKFLLLLNEAVEKNELKRNEYGDEYFEGPLDVIKKYYN